MIRILSSRLGSIFPELGSLLESRHACYTAPRPRNSNDFARTVGIDSSGQDGIVPLPRGLHLHAPSDQIFRNPDPVSATNTQHVFFFKTHFMSIRRTATSEPVHKVGSQFVRREQEQILRSPVVLQYQIHGNDLAHKNK